MFDVASASALCESPEHEAAAVSVGLACLQQFVLTIQNGLASAPPATAAQAQQDAAQLAQRIEGLVRMFAASDAAGGIWWLWWQWGRWLGGRHCMTWQACVRAQVSFG